MRQDFELVEADPSELDESDLGTYRTDAVVTATDWTTETILSQLKRGNIELSPRFQRREAWRDDRKSAFIESLFLGLPVPQIVLAERPERRGSYIVIDGKQRLLSIRRFGVEADEDEDGFVALRLTGLQSRTDLNGQTWLDMKQDSTFAEEVMAYENQTIRTVVVRHWQDPSFLYLVFLRLNTGSVPLSSQELRQALHPGPFTEFAENYSAESQWLKKALKLDSPDFRMRDVEIFTRFFAFSEFLHTYTGNLKDFLDDASKRLNDNWVVQRSAIEELAKQCDLAVECTMDIFGDNAFRRWRKSTGFEGRFNRAVFDIMTYYFRHSDIRASSLTNEREVKQAFIDLCDNDDKFTDALQTTTKSIQATFGRLHTWGDRLRTVLQLQFEIPEIPPMRRRG